MAITDDEIKQLSEKEKKWAELQEKGRKMQQDLKQIEDQLQEIQIECREKFGIAPGEQPTISNQIKLIKKALN